MLKSELDFSEIQSFCKKGIFLKDYTTWKIGGKADYFFTPKNENELKLSLRFISKNRLNFFLLGNGSNVLFDDAGVRGAVIKLCGEFNTFHIKKNIVNVGSSVWAPFLCRKLGDKGLSGVEHIVGIPATLGGLTYMNGGSKRKNLSQNILNVRVMDTSGIVHKLLPEDCDFSYRESVFKSKKDWIIISTELKLEQKNPKEVKAEMLQILNDRSKKFPRKMPNCGSVFQSVGEVYEKHGPPGKILEDLGFKGKRHGSMYISNIHSNFMIHDGDGSSEDAIEFIEIIQSELEKHIGCRLPVEPLFITPDLKLIQIH